MLEIWRPINDFPDYAISNHGRVKRLTRSNMAPAGYLLKPRLVQRNIKGHKPHCYYTITLHKHQHDRNYFIHRLVLEAFKGLRPTGHIVNHIDFNGLNNSLLNLEYVTPKENSQHSMRHGRFSRGTDRWSAKLDEEKVKDILLILKQGGISQVKLAKTYKISVPVMNKIANRKLWKHITID